MKKYDNNLHHNEQKQTSGGAVNLIKDLLIASSGNAASTGLKWGVGTALTKTVFRRLPAPLNFVVPIIAEKIITKDTVDSGREILLKGLRWVKKATDEKPEVKLQPYN
ncbi:hypothetical protein [Dyadobacter sp. NIV53]|uniref:hypothetical protein n=1 Tax=Dyadobacter sp. NIV53 TaxID=2861765 RepID=UPI001C88BB89|nr:hypothetical protein [Dyadobacter sp. NIV53]